MAESSPTYNSGGIGLGGLMFAIFFTLKILGIQPVASWSWWLVLMPLLVSLALSFLIVCVGLALLVAADSVAKR